MNDTNFFTRYSNNNEMMAKYMTVLISCKELMFPTFDDEMISDCIV